jgi:hypothetical protein
MLNIQKNINDDFVKSVRIGNIKNIDTLIKMELIFKRIMILHLNGLVIMDTLK